MRRSCKRTYFRITWLRRSMDTTAVPCVNSAMSTALILSCTGCFKFEWIKAKWGITLNRIFGSWVWWFRVLPGWECYWHTVVAAVGVVNGPGPVLKTWTGVWRCSRPVGRVLMFGFGGWVGGFGFSDSVLSTCPGLGQGFESGLTSLFGLYVFVQVIWDISLWLIFGGMYILGSGYLGYQFGMG